MSRFKKGTVYATLASALWIAGCATSPPKEETAELQLMAIQRWSACLERNADGEKMPLVEVSKLMNQDCEGYKRDIIALFPPHMAGQVDQMLVSSAYRHIESLDDHNEEPAQADDLVQTVLR